MLLTSWRSHLQVFSAWTAIEMAAAACLVLVLLMSLVVMLRYSTAPLLILQWSARWIEFISCQVRSPCSAWSGPEHVEGLADGDHASMIILPLSLCCPGHLSLPCTIPPRFKFATPEDSLVDTNMAALQGKSILAAGCADHRPHNTAVMTEPVLKGKMTTFFKLPFRNSVRMSLPTLQDKFV